jgi:hypothetical protein
MDEWEWWQLLGLRILRRGRFIWRKLCIEISFAGDK